MLECTHIKCSEAIQLHIHELNTVLEYMCIKCSEVQLQKYLKLLRAILTAIVCDDIIVIVSTAKTIMSSYVLGNGLLHPTDLAEV